MGLLLSKAAELRGIPLLPNPPGICGFSHIGKGKWGLLSSNTWRHWAPLLLLKVLISVQKVLCCCTNGIRLLTRPEFWCYVSSPTQDVAIPFWTWEWPGDGSENAVWVYRKCNARLTKQRSQRWQRPRVTPPFTPVQLRAQRPFNLHRAGLWNSTLRSVPVKGWEQHTSKRKHVFLHKGKDSQKTSQCHHVAASSKWAGAKSVPKCLG